MSCGRKSAMRSACLRRELSKIQNNKMKKYISTIVMSIVALATPLSLNAGQMRVNSASNPNAQPPDNNVTYTETGDAGQSIGTAQGTGPSGQALSQIFGSIGTVGDADIFIISITNAAAFSATTVNAGTGAGLDTSLFLFNSAGRPVYANDDADGLTLQSTLPAGNALGPVTTGIYYLAISLSGSEPVNFANQLLFATGSSTDVRGPNGIATGPEVGFDSSLVAPGSPTGAYEIDLTGAVTAVPEPSVPATFILGSLVSAGIFFARKRRRFGRAVLSVGALFALLTASVFATDVPKNLGNGLDKLVASRVALKAQAKKGQTSAIGQFNGFATEEAANTAAIAITDSTNRFLVDIHPNGRVPFNQLKDNLSAKFPSLQITATDANYHNVGWIEGYISIDDVAALASMRGVVSVQLGIKPYHNKAEKLAGPIANIGPVTSAYTLVGTNFDQGVTQHRVDKINQIYNAAAPVNYDGSGMQVGCISDSFTTRSTGTGGAVDAAAGNLPGAASPYNTTPVVVLQDFPGGTDEGRGMCQIVYKMAPRAKIAFATADSGELGFANNIRALAGLAGFTYPNQTFKADTICDDVGYYDEPIYEDGIIANGIDDAAAAGVSYFSSASNDVGTNGYESDFRLVPYTGGTTAADCPALVGTNINLTGVPPELYAGGFHNFNPNPGQQDVAQTWAMPNGAPPTVLQWDDPYDQNTAAILDPALYHNSGTITAVQTTVTFTDIPALTAGQLYEIDEVATGGGLDGTITLKDPSNNTVVSQDNTIDETVRFFAPVTGSGYTLIIGRFSTTVGTFNVDIYHSSGFGAANLITTDFNLLGFNVATGAYSAAASLIANNFATNQPVDLAVLSRPSSAGIQFVLARRNTPAASPQPASHFRIKAGGNGATGLGPLEYLTYNTVATGGHNAAKGCNGSAAYSVFRPSIPESFTSPGAIKIFFDKTGNRLATPEIRLQPTIAAADRANQTWTSGDDASDVDTLFGQFSGTSAAGPHAAAVAALVLQAHGGPGTVTPTQMTSVLAATAFQHDLDPYFVSGSARATNGGKVVITVNSDNSNTAIPTGTNPPITIGGQGLQDANTWTVSYVGPGFLTNLTFNPAGTAGTAGGTTNGNNGVDTTNTYFSNIYPGMVFMPATKAFTLGTLNGLVAADVTVPLSTTPFTGFSNLAPLPSNGTSQFWTMAIGFPNSNFTGGKAIHFTVGRGIQHSSSVGNATFNVGPTGGTTAANSSADLLGGGVVIPEGTIFSTGMVFGGTVSDGVTSYPFSGNLNNRIGKGYSTLDGFGFLNAEAAVNAPLQ